jgi:hypothetical protein
MTGSVIVALTVGIATSVVFSDESFRVQMTWSLALAFLAYFTPNLI